MNSEIYLLTPPEVLSGELAIDQFVPSLLKALDGGPVSCVLLSGTANSEVFLQEIASTLRPLVQERNIAFLIEDHFKLAASLGCDGVHLTSAENFKDAREFLGDDSIVGVDCGISRHDAILVGEAGADYVAFNNRKPLPEIDDPDVRAFEEGGPRGSDLLTWWQTMMTPPCVSMDDVSIADAVLHAEAGADFVAVQNAVWQHTADPAIAIAEINEAIA
ncbi:thiamine phosphate synthase [Kiloniella antarctica]|uniref:Thiamine phosphate synthase n=1 Tax=Kiloniella antarctica TaxID=1550907 RepID=A0ABW5BGC3_9PROT